MVDPSLDQVLGRKSDEDKEVDDLLEEVSDLDRDFGFYQRNRNLILPTSQDRYSDRSCQWRFVAEWQQLPHQPEAMGKWHVPGDCRRPGVVLHHQSALSMRAGSALPSPATGPEASKEPVT